MAYNMRDDIKEVYFTEEQLRDKVRELGARITEDYRGKNPLIVSVLKGSYIFMADLTRAIDTPCNVDFMVVSSYGNGTKTTGEVQIIKDIAQPIDGRDLLIVEDILDSGVTLHYLMQILAARGANSIRLCTLLSKPERRKIDVNVDYLGFEIPDEFVVGYGLDYAEKYRNLPYIGILKPHVYGGEGVSLRRRDLPVDHQLFERAAPSLFGQAQPVSRLPRTNTQRCKIYCTTICAKSIDCFVKNFGFF